MRKDVLNLKSGPKVKGPYAPAVSYNNLVFVSGQGPVDSKTGEIKKGSFEDQTRQALDNASYILEASGSGVECTIKTTVYLANLDNFATMNSIYEEYFGSNMTARTTFEVSKLPFDIAFEIDVVAHLRET